MKARDTTATATASSAEPAGSPTNTPFFKTPYNHDTEAEGNKHTVQDFGPSLTLQSMAEDADINVMMKRMGITGRIPDPSPELAQYILSGGGTLGDVGEFDFRTALEQVRYAEQLFMQYPADLRGRFENDPGKFLNFCAQESNRDELKRLGLLKPETPPPDLSRDTKAIVEALKGSKAIDQGAPGAPLTPKTGGPGAGTT